jgi:hypothetical protein
MDRSENETSVKSAVSVDPLLAGEKHSSNDDVAELLKDDFIRSPHQYGSETDRALLLDIQSFDSIYSGFM